MKKAYNETWIDNLAIQQTAENWRSKKLITDEQFSSVKAIFPENFYRPGLFVKIGLFIFACIACSFFTGFISLFILDAGDKAFSVVSILCCISFTLFLEYLIKDRKLFHSGIDNALLYAALGASVVPFFMLFDNLQVWQYCVLALVILTAATLRYADLFVVICAYLVIFTLLANLMMKFPLGKALLPFAVIALSLIIFYLARKIKSTYYADCKKLVEVLALITLYLGGNYYIVREGNALLSDLSYLISPQIPFAPIFYGLSAIIPLAYVFLGLKFKDRILLLVGLFALGFSIFTYRYYFDFITVAQGLTILGFLMIMLSIVCIRFLKETKYGLTDEADDERKTANLEALIASQYLGQTPQEQGLAFGGGSFSGGGAGNGY